MIDETLAKVIMLFVRIRNRIYRYFYFSNFEKKHITYGIVGGKFQITSISHEEFIIGVQKRMVKFAKNYDQGTFISSVLTEALNGCNFVIFSPADDDNKYVQFWTGEHLLKFNFYANKPNRLKKYYYSIIGLLSESGFVDDNTPDYRGFKNYKVKKGLDYISVDANFKKDIELAVKFTNTVFKEIYKIKDKKLLVKIE